MTHIQLRALQIMGPRATAEELNHAEQVLTDRPEVLNLFDALFSLPAGARRWQNDIDDHRSICGQRLANPAGGVHRQIGV